MSSKIPVTVLTGFLGSGKTTLLNRILHETHGQRIAVIENEFGEIGIDQDLVINADEEIFEMNNGCICCTVRGDLIRILGNLARRKDRFDRVILETTGLADPAPVAQTFFVDEEIREEYALDAVITLVDARHILQHIDDSAEALSQIAFADVILLNKCDLVGSAQLRDVSARIDGINSLARRLPVTMAQTPLDTVLDLGGFNLDRALAGRPTFLEPEYPFEWAGIYLLGHGNYTLALDNGPDPAMALMLVPVDNADESELKSTAERVFRQFSGPATPLDNHGSIRPGVHHVLALADAEKYFFNFSLIKRGYYALYSQHTPEEFGLQLAGSAGTCDTLASHYFNPAHSHDDAVGSVALEYQGNLDEVLFTRWIGTLLREQGQDIFRTKGIVSFTGDDKRNILQGVHMMMEVGSGEPWEDAQRYSRLVFIGKNLDRTELQECFDACKA